MFLPLGKIVKSNTDFKHIKNGTTAADSEAR